MASKAQIIDFLLAGYRDKQNDQPLNAGTITVTVAGTSNVAYVWDDRDKTLPTTTGRSTITLDAYGKAEVYGDGIYKFVIKDSSGSTIETIDYAEYAGHGTTQTDTVFDLAALRAVTSFDAPVYLQYRTALGDGGEGNFQWDSSDLTTEVTNDINSGVYVAPNTDLTGASGAWVRQFDVLLPDYFGAVGDGTLAGGGTDSYIPLQEAMDFAIQNELALEGRNGATYRISDTLLNQRDGIWKPFTFDFSKSLILVDFAGKAGMIITGGQKIQTFNLFIRPTTAYAQATLGYTAADTGVFMSNVKMDCKIESTYFKGDNVIISSTASNANSAKFDIRALYGGRGILITGTQDDLSAVESTLYAFGNNKEGVRVEANTAFRQWTGQWTCESNWASDNANPLNYGVYIGKAIQCNLWIYCEQALGASEIYLNPTECINCEIHSARRSKDTITGSSGLFFGTTKAQLDYNDKSGSYRVAVPQIIRGLSSRISVAGDQVKMPFQDFAEDQYGGVMGEADGIHLYAPAELQQISVYDDRLELGIEDNELFTDKITLTTGTPSLAIGLKTISVLQTSTGTLTVAGRSGGSLGDVTYTVPFYVVDSVVTLGTPLLNVFPGTLPPTVVLAVAADILTLTLSYNSGQWGPSYIFSYNVQLITA